MIDPPHRDALVRAYLEAYNTRDVPGLVATLHPEVRFAHVSRGETTVATQGLEAFRALAVAALRLFSSRRQVVQAIDHDAAGTTIRVDFEGLLAEDVPGLGRAGERVTLVGTSRFTFRDGCIDSIEDRS